MLKKILFLACAVCLFFAMQPTVLSPDTNRALAFSDVSDAHDWAKTAISYMTEEGILEGIDQDNYAPDDGVTKEQLAKMLTLSLSVETDPLEIQTYTDVPQSRWSFPYVEAVKDFFPIEADYPVNEFAPQKPMNRQEVAYVIIKGMGLSADSQVFNKGVLESYFRDADQVSVPLKTPVIVAVERGILRGADGLLRPEAPVTRAEAAVLLHRMILIRQGRGELVFLTNTPMLGDAQVSLEQAKAWAQDRGAHQRFVDIADIYWKYGEITGIRPEILYAQAAKETGFGKYTGRVVPEQNNWAGIKTATANGDKTEDHETFATPDDGVRGHFNHMSAYIGLSPVGEPHGRYAVACRTAWAGTVTTAEELGTKWAPEHSYGYSLVSRYLIPMMNTEV